MAQVCTTLANTLITWGSKVCSVALMCIPLSKWQEQKDSLPGSQVVWQCSHVWDPRNGGEKYERVLWHRWTQDVWQYWNKIPWVFWFLYQAGTVIWPDFSCWCTLQQLASHVSSIRKGYMSVNKPSMQGWQKMVLLGAMIYLFVSAFEHNRKGAVTNQILPAELKLPDSLHDQRKENKRYSFKMSLYTTNVPHDISLSTRNTISHFKRLIWQKVQITKKEEEKNNTRNQTIVKAKLKSNFFSKLPWHPVQVSYLREDCFRHGVRYYCPRPTYGSFS